MLKSWTAVCELRAGDRLQLVNGEYAVVEQVQHEILESPVTVYNFEVADFHTYYVGDASILVHNLCESKVMSRKDAIKEGKNFLGDGFTKVKTGYYKSADGLRTMRFDVTHHGGSSIHINLETWKNPVSKGVRNKLLKNVHIFFE